MLRSGRDEGFRPGGPGRLVPRRCGVRIIGAAVTADPGRHTVQSPARSTGFDERTEPFVAGRHHVCGGGVRLDHSCLSQWHRRGEWFGVVGGAMPGHRVRRPDPVRRNAEHRTPLCPRRTRRLSRRSSRPAMFGTVCGTSVPRSAAGRAAEPGPGETAAADDRQGREDRLKLPTPKTQLQNTDGWGSGRVDWL